MTVEQLCDAQDRDRGLTSVKNRAYLRVGHERGDIERNGREYHHHNRLLRHSCHLREQRSLRVAEGDVARVLALRGVAQGRA